MRSFPWDSVVEAMGNDGLPIYDRAYSASDLQDIMTIFFSNGVFMNTNNALQVTAGANMTVIVAPGRGMIRGTSCIESSSRGLEMVAASSKDRIDTVVLRWDANLEQRNIDLYVVQGIASDSPVRPQLTRTETIYELGLADVFVPKNTTAVSDERITDTRLETERCGVCTPFAKIDTATFYNQINAALDKQVGELREQTDKAVELSQELIDGTAIGNLEDKLQGEIDGKLDIDGKAVDSAEADHATRADAASAADKLQTARTMQTNLGSTTAASFDGTSNVSLGIAGILSAAHGGTGQTSLQAARNAMGLGNTTGVLPIANGGTGTSSSDPVVASGTSGNWTYAKYNSGIAICAFKKNYTISTANQWNNIWAGSQIKPDNYPFTFTAIPTTTAMIFSDGYRQFWASGIDNGSTTAPPGIHPSSDSSKTNVATYVCLIAIGRWK